MCIYFKIDGAQIFSRMCMCIEFVIQVPKQKNAHVSFPFGMVFQKLTCNPYVIITKMIRKLFMLCNPYVVPEQWLQREPCDYVK